MIEYFPPIDNAKDYIRRGDLLFKSTFRDGILDNSESILQRLDHYYVSLRQVYEASAADVKKVIHAHWIDENPEDLLDVRMRCSNCRTIHAPYAYWHYCPSCGAYMDGGNNK